MTEHPVWPGLRDLDALNAYVAAETAAQGYAPIPEAPACYGTDEETFYVNDQRTVYLIQSPSLTLPFEKLSGLPLSAELLSEDVTADLEIPDEIR